MLFNIKQSKLFSVNGARPPPDRGVRGGLDPALFGILTITLECRKNLVVD